ncbi:MAG: energy-coupling factor ABC transporter ATP-binding protein [Gammaproteobacteria bacterium]|nr:energy-coupling factor ABC transporter ATP-binding protein [Gammaproteobacteria bacterium]
MNYPSNTAWLQLNGIYFNRAGRTILSDISLQFCDGELTLLTGHNGSGKTTLLRILAGLLKPDSALLEIDSHEKTGNWIRSQAILRDNSCYLHQQPYLFDASVFDNVSYGLHRRGLETTKIKRQVMDALEATALAHLCRRHCSELSGGEQQRVAMVRAWVLKPRLMLLDEPVANMDKPSRRQCLALINQMQQDNITVMLTSHDPQQGKLQISRHLHLYHGRMINKKPAASTDQPLPTTI